MSVFRALLKQAHEQGATRISFDVDLDAFFANEESESWRARSNEHPTSFGRSGEEALRNLVEPR